MYFIIYFRQLVMFLAIFAIQESKIIDNESNTISQSIYKDTRF